MHQEDRSQDNDGSAHQILLLDPIPALVAAAASKDVEKFQQTLREHPDVNAWMDALIARLLPTTTGSDDDSSSTTTHAATIQEEALLIVGTLAQLDPENYLLPISKSFNSRMTQVATRIGGGSTEDLVIISPALLKVWIQQVTQTSQVAVHSLLLKALVQAIRVQGPVLAQTALQELASIWQYHWSSMIAPPQGGTTDHSRETSSIVAVRCAATFVECVVALGDVALSAGQSVGATFLLTSMLQQSEDPLLQLAILDLFPEHFQATTEIQVATRAWLTSPEFVHPILDMLEDPLLEGAALLCATWISTMEGDAGDADAAAAPSMSLSLRTRILNIIQDKGVLSSESDRLAVVQALVQMSKSAPSTLLDAIILKSPRLRCAWWDMTRLSSPKLQAAILSSVAQVISSLRSSSPPHQGTIGTRLYSLLAGDNGASTTSTTDWLYTKFAKSPMPELRIATYAVWSAVAGLGGSSGATVLSASTNLWELLLEGGRETSTDARVAKYEVMENLYENAQGFLAVPLQNKLKKLLNLGPHGLQAIHQWDVATE